MYIHISEFTQYCAITAHGSNTVAKCALMPYGSRRYHAVTATAPISIVMQSAARGCSGTARNAPFQRITLSARAREMRQKLVGCDCFPCFPIESSRNYFRCPFVRTFLHSFVHSCDWRTFDRRTFDRSRIATVLFARSRRNVKTLRTIYDTGS